ncbi:MAG: alkaline phosphatase [Bacteroidales bacterium]|nr:alkaline phosphatase [Bacteroidales bacterium]
MYKKIIVPFLIFFSLFYSSVFAQVSIGTGLPDPSAVLDLTSEGKGTLLPRMTTPQRNAIVHPADGLTVYDTEENELFFFQEKKNQWTRIAQDATGENPEEELPVKNIILMIGDGMGFSQIQAGLIYKSGFLEMTTLPFTGIVRTYSADNKTTDSAASATALSTGTKTNNYYVGVDPQGKRLVNIMEEVKEKGLSTGIVVTSSVTHATPAAFYAHQKSRDSHTAIAGDFSSATIDVCIGGGNDYFSTSLKNSIKSKGYTIVSSLDNITSDKNKILALLANNHMPRMSNGRGNMLSLGVGKALDILKKNENGFFLMVEGSQIDFAGHNSDSKYMLEELVDFDNAVRLAKAFAEENGNTLLLVTADHENGGLIVYGDKKLETYYTNRVGVKGAHSSAPVPIFSYGPGAQQFVGVMDNIDIHKKIRELLNLK